MTRPESHMRREVREIPEAVARLLDEGEADLAAAAAALAERDPRLLVTVARGSSDHVCTYLKYVSELLLGVPVASIGPSVASVYHASLKLDNAACIVVSQSGQSPDIVETARAFRAGRALTIALTNVAGSPLAGAADRALAIRAGAERSVAATKTFVTSAVAGLSLLARWKDDRALLRAIAELPEHLDRAAALDWPEMRGILADRPSLYTLGRGPAYAISNEAALKFKEVCQLHAESYSSAEVLHGPVSIVELGFPVLAFAAADAAETPLVEIADRIAAKGAAVLVTSDRARQAQPLQTVRTGHPLCDPLCLIVSFYAMIERLATDRGIDPDAPRHLNKITQTL